MSIFLASRHVSLVAAAYCGETRKTVNSLSSVSTMWQLNLPTCFPPSICTLLFFTCQKSPQAGIKSFFVNCMKFFVRILAFSSHFSNAIVQNMHKNSKIKTHQVMLSQTETHENLHGWKNDTNTKAPQTAVSYQPKHVHSLIQKYVGLDRRCTVSKCVTIGVFV